ncbi:hypothetical protein [Jannaschia sp. M317]|uniref:hypothetical protein n=1 Tax=Jannaschia sp. M317 TaxID=2867011 RepID=UPI0021A8312C|nr:hypothetical protein [Jannaschia sp. M317]UWQ16568.1 hypothetical protein K3551_11660 [Jannaschia sp. M317]
MISKFALSTVLLASAVALAGCNSSNKGGGGAAGGGANSSNAAHNAAFNAVSAQGATTTMPATFTGAFTGSVQAQLGSMNGANTPLGHATGDLALTANWTDGQAGPAFTGTATNFAGEVQGAATTWNGTLNASSSGALNRIQRFDGAAICAAAPAGVPCPVDPNAQTSSVTIAMTGALTADGGTAGNDSNLVLNGFVTNDNQSITGATAGTFILPDGSTATVAGTESTFHATK